MRPADRVEPVADTLAGWLRAHATEFAPLAIRGVRPAVVATAEGEPAVELTVLLDGSPVGWPPGAVFELIDAVNAEARRRGWPVLVQVFPQPVAAPAA